jgi:hypothetical protein
VVSFRWKRRSKQVQSLERQHRRTDLRWPIGIAIGLALVILVNLAFIYIAVSGADDVAPSYQSEPR